MADSTLRTSVPEDAAELAALERRTWSTLHEVQPGPRPAAQPFFDDTHLPEDYLVALLEDRIVGFVRYVSPTWLPANAHVRQIQGLVVAPAARGGGVGRRLVEAACERAARNGVRRMTLRVLSHNLPARRLYERAGFTVEGILPEEFWLDGRYVDDILMGRDLTGH